MPAAMRLNAAERRGEIVVVPEPDDLPVLTAALSQVTAFEPDKKDVEAEIAILRDELYQEERP